MALQRNKKVSVSIVVPFVVFALFFTIMIWQKYQASHELTVAPTQQPATERHSITLFFLAEDGTSLAREAREIDSCDDDNACLKAVLEELLKGPVSSLTEAVPETTAVEDVRIEGGLALINLNREFADGLITGSSSEMMAVYSLVNSVTLNIPAVTGVKIMVAGNPRTVLSHLDLSEPLQADYSLEQNVTTVPPVDASGAKGRVK